jgi:hypothetical protein
LYGTLIFSNEGFNGQFSLSEKIVLDFKQALLEIDNNVFNNVDINIGDTINYENTNITFPYKKLIVRRKNSILTDGLNEVLNWDDGGEELLPNDWHEKLKTSISNIENEDNSMKPIIIGKLFLLILFIFLITFHFLVLFLIIFILKMRIFMINKKFANILIFKYY